MKKSIYQKHISIITFTLMLCMGAMFKVQAQEPVYKGGIRQGRVLVKFKENEQLLKSVAAQQNKKRAKGQFVPFDSSPKLNQLAQTISVNNITPLFQGSPKFAERFKREGLDRWFILDYSEDQSPMSVTEAFKQIADVEIAEPQVQLTLPEFKVLEEVDMPTTYATNEEQAVNDPRFPNQWHYHNVGQTGGTVGADINLVNAWKKRMDASQVIVAIMDQGVDVTHEDLKANVWINEAELHGTPGVDDDGNGVVDDIYGFDFGNGYGQIEKGPHGTHVAGTVAAVTNNGIGVAGIAGGDGSGNGARIMTLPVFGANQDRAANAYIYAADNGALISQNSWGYSAPGVTSEAYEEAIRYFVKYAGCDNSGNQLPGSLMQGGIAIFASGNVASTGQYYPACMEEVVAVSSLTHTNTAAGYSNYDTWVDVSAYGGETSAETERGVLSTYPGNKYVFMEGTSMACPHVSGVAALALAELGGPGFTEAMLRNYVTLTARDNEKNYSLNYKGMMGKGIVDAMNAMTRNDGLPPTAIADLQLSAVADNYCSVNFSAPAKSDGSKVENYRMVLTSSKAGERSEIYTNTAMPGEPVNLVIRNLLPNTDYQIVFYSNDIWGVTSEASNSVSFKTATRKGNLTYINPVFNTVRTNLDYSKQQTWEVEIELSNNATEEDAGGLFWRADGYEMTHQNTIPRTSRLNFKSAGPDQLMIAPLAVAQESEGTLDRDLIASLGYKGYLTYRKDFYPEHFIGEVKEKGQLFKSSAAQKIVVPESMKEGFILSHIDFGIQTSSCWLFDDELENPKDLELIFEFYRGGDMPAMENRIYRGVLRDHDDNTLTIMRMPFRVHLSAGEHIWIVVHADERYMYPLGVNSNGDHPEYSYYSGDEGKSWKKLSEVYTSLEKPVFTMGALSDGLGNKPYIRLEPASGHIGKGETQKIKAIIDYADVKEGVDSTMIFFNTDGTVQKGRNQLNLVATVKRDELVPEFSAPLYEFGMVSFGDRTSKKVRIYNRGLAHLKLDDLALSNTTDFEIISKVPAILYAKDSMDVEVAFIPKGLGAKSGNITISGRSVSASGMLVGTCVEAPEASIKESQLKIDVVGNDVKEYAFTLQNSSAYPLKYDVLTLLKGDEKISLSEAPQELPSAERTDTTDFFGGYSWVDNHMGKGYAGSPWREISQTGTELTRRVDGLNMFTKISLPFAFRYYDRVVKELFVGINGVVRLDSCSDALPVPVQLPYVATDKERGDEVGGIIAPLWVIDGSQGHFQKTKFYHQNFDDCVVIQFTGGLTYFAEGPSNYQVAIYPDGTIEFRYKEIFSLGPVIANSFLVGWSSPDGNDGRTLFFTSYQIVEEIQDENYCIKISPAPAKPFEAIDNVKYSGIVAPLSDAQVRFNVNPKDLPLGNTTYHIEVETNDPAHKKLRFPVVFEKKDEMSAEFQFKESNFGEMIFTGVGEVDKEVLLFNTSKVDGDVSLSFSNDKGIKFGNGSATTEITLLKNTSKAIGLKLTGDVDTEVIAKDKVTGKELGRTRLRATALGYDNVNLALLGVTELNYDLGAGEKATQTITINADADYKSRFFLPGFITIKEQEEAKPVALAAQENIDFAGYRWLNSSDPEAPQFIWNDISKTGTRLNLDPNLEYDGHDLPFDYPFYGVKYNKVYVSPNGRISPYPVGWDIMWDYVPSRRLPSSEVAIPLISAMWARQWYYPDNKDAGIFYEITEDKMTIQYHLFFHDWVVTNGFTSYQVILHKDGTVQFIYPDINNCDLRSKVTIGMQGEGGSSEVGYTYTLSANIPIPDETTVTAKPIYGPVSIKNAEQLKLDFVADSYGYKAGTYHDTILIVSDNLQKQVKLPVTMTVGENARLNTKHQSFDFGGIKVGEEIEPKALVLSNEGNVDLAVSSFEILGDGASAFTLKKPVFVEKDMIITTTYEDVTFPLNLRAFQSAELAVFVTPENANRTMDATLHFKSDFNDLTIPVTARSIRPVQLAVTDTDGKSEMAFSLSNVKEIIERQIRVSREEGAEPINYKLGVEVYNQPLPMPLQTESASANKAHDPFKGFYIKNREIEKSVLSNMKPFAINSTGAEPFSTVSVIKDNAPDMLIGTAELGAEYGLSCFVKMDTEDAGFLLSHVRFWTNTVGRDTSKVEIRVYEDCLEPSREHLLYEKEHYLSMNVPVVGDLILPLERSLAFAPHQKFWIEVYFSPKLQAPMAIATNPDGEPDGKNFYRLYNGYTEQWLAFYPYAHKFAIWAIQESYSDLTRWLTVATDSVSIAPGAQNEHSIQANALHFPMAGMKMKITANTTEIAEVTPLTLTADKFVEPVWEVFPEKPLMIDEGQTITIPVKAIDPQGSAVTYRLGSSVEGVKLAKQADGSATITYSAPYTASFVTNVNIEASSDKGVSVRRISIGNIDVNRKPIALPVKPITLSVSSMGPIVLPVSYFFVDPDGDEMQFSGTFTSNGVGVDLTQKGFVFSPRYEDMIDVTLTATDGEFEVKNRFRVNVVTSLNNPPLLMKNIENRTIKTGTGFEIDLKAYFLDQESDPLEYETWSTNEVVATASCQGSTLTVASFNEGSTAIAVKAIDKNKVETLTSFEVVAQGKGQQNMQTAEVKKTTISPNPSKTVAMISYEREFETESDVRFTVKDISGKVMTDGFLVGNGDSDLSVTINVENFVPGVYIVQISCDNEVVSTEKLIVID